MKKLLPIPSFLAFLCSFVSALSTQPPGPAGPTNITVILVKADQFTTFNKLLKSVQQSDQINNQLNNSNQGQGLTLFTPPDNAFANLKPGTLNSLSDQQKVQLVQFHVLPNFVSMSQFHSVSNPLRTQAGNSNARQFPLNVTTSGSQVNFTTSVVDAVVANTNYTDGQLVVYHVTS
ncbi:fasciclin-like arabinogalactan protein 11 [Momordica charantia]|uniref:Fasciclin-like arabinogalactan protein 11 n=1 Tax=Momordica charantia TaxID=3673 RepID=A0A6J1DCD1_MOMCH|nr:fasciclin-like arabinogalactan protein 11 [Momordica charantia]